MEELLLDEKVEEKCLNNFDQTQKQHFGDSS